MGLLVVGTGGGRGANNGGMRILAAIWLIVWGVSVAAGQVRPAVERIDAIVGHPLVVPVWVEDERSLAPIGGGTRVRIALDDGQTPGVSFFRLEQSGVVDGGWIGWVPRYRAVPAAEAVRRSGGGAAGGGGGGVWYAVVDLPLEAVSQGLWFGADRYEVNWLPDPERASLEAGGRALWATPLPAGAWDSAPVRDALRAVAEDPFQRWRVRLARDGIAPMGGQDRTGAGGTDLAALGAELEVGESRRFLDELARHHEARWQLILGRLSLIDAEVGARMRRQLGGVVQLDGRWVPMWTPDSPELRALQADLLSPWVDDQTRALRALGWLDAQAKALAWVIDDAGDPGTGDLGGPGSRLVALLGLLSMPARDAPLLVEVGGSLESPLLESAPVRRAVTVRTGVPLVERRAGTVRTVAVPVRIGATDTVTEAIATIPAARPPGVRLGPLLRGWSMPALLESAPEKDALPEMVATGVLRRAAGARGGVASGWSVFIECVGRAGVVGDAVTVWTGPYGLPRGVWRVSRDGTVHRLFGPWDLVSVRAVETPGGWAMDVELPAGAVDEDGVLRLGLTREMGGGDGTAVERTSWPRRMTPGQDEPGRLPVDVGRWTGF